MAGIKRMTEKMDVSVDEELVVAKPTAIVKAFEGIKLIKIDDIHSCLKAGIVIPL